MAFWKVYKYRSKNQHMFDWIHWYSTYGQYDEETRAKIEEQRRINAERREKEGQQALNQLLAMSAIMAPYMTPFLRASRKHII